MRVSTFLLGVANGFMLVQLFGIDPTPLQVIGLAVLAATFGIVEDWGSPIASLEENDV